MPERLNVKYCRHCGQLIPLRAVDCPYCGRGTIRGEDQKQCPFCGELIKAKALKCKHCGEFLDGRAAGVRPPQIVKIEKAVITGIGREGEVELYRPDGQRISLKPPEMKALPEAEPAGPSSRQLEERTEGAVPVRRRADVPAGRPDSPAPARARAEPAVMPPEVQYECPSCKRFVFEGDRFCQNCGRDLSIPKGQPAIPVRSKPYGPTDYALMISAAAPVGLLLRFPVGVVIGVCGAVLGLWCLARIFLSGGSLNGAGRAAGAVGLGLFWVLLMWWGVG